MTNVVKLTDETYIHLNQVPELVKLYAQIDCDSQDCVLEKANNIAKEIEQYDGRRMRIIEVRNAFKKSANLFSEYLKKPIHDGFVESVKQMFKVALLAGYETIDQLHEKLELSKSPLEFNILSDNARDARIQGEARRKIGLAARELRREDEQKEIDTIVPLPHPRAVGQAPQ